MLLVLTNQGDFGDMISGSNNHPAVYITALME